MKSIAWIEMGKDWNFFESKEENLSQMYIKSVGNGRESVQRTLKIMRRLFPEKCRIE